MTRIHDSLQTVFKRHRLVFWYDPDHQWAEAFDSFEDATIHKLRVEGNEFGVKVAMHRNPDRAARYLLYFPTARPPDSENWLLDLLMQGHEYKADRASLALQEAGLPYEFHPLIEEHVKFFDSAKRAQAFQNLVSPGDDAHTLRLKMMAVLTGAAPEVDALLLWSLGQAAEGSLVDPVEEHLGAAGLTGYFWKNVSRAFGYTSESPSLTDFTTMLFRWANPLDSGVSLDAHSKVFLQQWKDSRDYSPAFRQWSERLEVALHVSDRLNDMGDVQKLGSSDTFEAFDKYILHWLCRAFVKGGDDAVLLDVIQTRRGTFWFSEYAHGYEALAQAIALRDLVASAELKVESIDAGVNRYVERWHHIDTAYRKFCYHQRVYGQVALLAHIVEWVEKTYVNNYLLPLADRWGDQVREMTAWKCTRLLPQTAFFDHYVRPFAAKSQKVIVVISDALRYEAAAEFASHLRAENRWTAELEAVFVALPSYTQLGMAALLPGVERSIDPSDGTLLVDGKSATGTPARAQILAATPDIKATAIQAADFLELKTKTDARALLREHDVVYIYHNHIDKVGDDLRTEAKTTEAVEQAFDELLALLRKVYNANGYNILLTADHGFLFQQSDIAVADDLPLPDATEWQFKNRRFALGRGIVFNPTVKVFSAAELGLVGNWQAAFPLALGRFPLQGSGKRYVHGGLSLQEGVVPVLRIHIARSDDTEQVDVDLLRVPDRITTGNITLSLYQDRPVEDKALPRTLRIGVFAPDGSALSEVRTVVFDSADPEPRQREKTLPLTMSRAADAFNNTDVEIRLEETLPGTAQTTTYKSRKVKLRKPIESDFDD
jgi:uncharacterized protein (TIGR02687 family)